MTDRLLENIIELEKHIQAEVAAEQTRADEWQERELAALQSACAAARATEEEHYRGRLAEKKVDLKHEAEALEAAASSRCQRLSTLDDETLCDVLKRHLAVILPGGWP